MTAVNRIKPIRIDHSVLVPGGEGTALLKNHVFGRDLPKVDTFNNNNWIQRKSSPGKEKYRMNEKASGIRGMPKGTRMHLRCSRKLQIIKNTDTCK